MARNGIVGAAQEEIVQGIKSFALYGFPESHAASFALLAYASAYLKAHHPAAFLCALLNNWPMGFYHPATLVTDAVRHGVEARPIDVTRSAWRCDVEDARARRCGSGLRYVAGLREETGRADRGGAGGGAVRVAGRLRGARAAERSASWRRWPRSARWRRWAERAAQALWQVDALGQLGRAVRARRATTRADAARRCPR